MGRRAAVALYVLAMVGVVVSVDVLFLRMLFWERLIVNIGIVLVFVVVYFRFLKRPLASTSPCGPVVTMGQVAGATRVPRSTLDWSRLP